MSPRSLTLAGVFAAVPVLLTGCGTINNFQTSSPTGRPRIYGGVREDLEFFVGEQEMFAGLIGLIDAPFSLVGDTLTLPRVIRAIRAARGDRSSSAR